jgi:hypothetical protein
MITKPGKWREYDRWIKSNCVDISTEILSQHWENYGKTGVNINFISHKSNQTQLQRQERDWIFCVINEECKVMVISEEIIGETEYLTQKTRCGINRWPYKRVRLYFNSHTSRTEQGSKQQFKPWDEICCQVFSNEILWGPYARFLRQWAFLTRSSEMWCRVVW